MHREGHEVGCHTYGHLEVFHQTREQFYEDTRRVKTCWNRSSASVFAATVPAIFRSCTTLWGLEVLAELDFDYDSSIFPVDRPRYGIPDWPRHPALVELPGGLRILEFPIASYHGLGKNWPVGGGGYHRLPRLDEPNARTPRARRSTVCVLLPSLRVRPARVRRN